MGTQKDIMWSFQKTPLTCEEALLKPIFLILNDSSRENETRKHIKNIVDIYKSNIHKKAEIVEAKNLLLNFFSRFSSKKNLKKYIQDIIGKMELSTSIIKSTTEEILEDINSNQICNIRQCTDLLNFVYHMQNSTFFEYEVTIESLFPLYFILFEGFIHQAGYDFEKLSLPSEELFALLNVVLKQILSVYVKNIPYLKVVAETYSARLINLAHSAVIHNKIGFDIKTKAGLIITHSFNIVPNKFRKKLKFKDCPPLDLVKDYNENDYFTFNNQKLDVLRNIDNLVIIYASVLSVYSKEKLFGVKMNGETLICLLYHNIMECAKSQTSIPHIIVEISRTLAMVSAQLKHVPRELIKSLFMEGISYVWNHIEHFVDTVRNYVRLFFDELVALAAHHKNEGYTDLVDALLINVKQLENNQPTRYLALEIMAVHLRSQYLLENFSNLPDDLLNSISEPTISDQVCKTYTVIMENNFAESDRAEWINKWVSPVTSLLKICSHCTPLGQKIITSAFQLHPPVLRDIFPNDYVGNTQESSVLLKCLQYARQNGMEVTVDKKEDTVLYWRGLIDKEKLEMFMTHQNDEIRVSVLAAIVDSQKTTEIFLDWELDYLITYIGYNITPHTPHIRKQILTYYKKALARFNAGLNVIIRNIGLLNRRLEATEGTQEALTILTIYQELEKSYKIFINKFTKLLISYLTFDSNYPRRATSLELLVTIQTFLPKNEWLSCWSEEDVKNCHSILFDSYECNKKMSVMLLKNLPAESIGFTNMEFTFKYMQRCLNIALGIKPNKTLSAAYLLEVCASSPFFYDIILFGNSKIDNRHLHDPILDMLVVLTGKLIAQSNVEVDYSNPKVANYGIFLSIRHLLQIRDMSKSNDAYAGLFEHLTTICLNLKDSIMPIVCNPSPEGYLPESGEIICESDESSRAQMVLVYSWRTMKEMTLMLAEIIRQSIKLESSIQMLADDLMIQVGQFFLDVFIESKHRGVFEQAYVGFSVICESFWMSSNPKVNCLPQAWLQDAINLCVGETQSDKLCATRRSAGLPFLILSILSSEPIFDKTRFHEVITSLLRACENTEVSNVEYRMHSLNVLRAMFRHSRLGEMVSGYIGQGVIVAINGFKSDTWGIRNSSTLLYAALITRIFGVQRTQDSEDVCIKNRLTVRIFFLRYPELFQFLLDQLSEECKKSNSLLLHPVLTILARLYPSPFEEHNTQIGKYLQHLTVCLSNPVYRTRELAARASVPFIETDQICEQLGNIFNKLKEDEVKDNECHGLLLQVLHILKSNNLSEIPLTRYLQNSVHILHYAGSKYSHMTISLYMETVMFFLMKYGTYDDLEMLKTILNVISNQMSSNQVPVTAMSKFCQTRILLLLYIVINKFEESDLTYPTVTNLIISQLYGPNMETKRFCLNLLIYFNQIQNDYKHALYQTEEMQIPPEIVILSDCFEKSSILKILTHLHQNLKCFLMQELKYQRHIKKEDQVLLFLLVNYYPCVIKYFNLSKQETLNTLLHYCDCDNEELISAVLSCISTFLLQLDYNVLQYNRLIHVLAESASPAASNYRRLAVCDFLSKNYILYCNEDPILLGVEIVEFLLVKPINTMYFFVEYSVRNQRLQP
ncbi:unnamed protein product [Phaedon cochleariae]|uniref:tRNA (32-2'-O)-methyltransferase regulator THADA n=1 Tax=Phaedon cochleariae TaxID=80249 RepID=A0A9N9X174_PHACE|nr:unnamed protein product [Phaedon cochleariae]